MFLACLATVSNAQQVASNLKEFSLGMKCTDALKVAEASVKDGLNFRPRWQDGVHA